MAKQHSDTSLAQICRFSNVQLHSEALVPVILEFQQPPVAVFRRYNPQGDADAYRRELEERQDQFLASLAGLSVQVGESTAVVAGPAGQHEVTLTHRFTDAFNGIGVWMPGRIVPEVAAMAGVRAVTLNQERVYLTLDRSVPFMGATRIWERLGAGNLPVRGEGILVAVIDTGIDWTHPALGGFTEVPNEKVVHAASFTGEQPLDNFGHGTHVAAIIAGDSSYKGTPRGDSLVDGVAPRARLLGYKVLTAAGSGSASNIVLAIEDAVKRGAHVINLSLGDSQGDPLSPESSAANNAMLAGVVVCAAAGNSGPSPSTIGAPGSAHHVITVGASTDDGVTTLRANWRIEGKPDRLVDMRLMEGSIPLPSPAVESAYLFCKRGVADADFPAAVKGRIALVERGEATFREKALAAHEAGAIACIIYNNQPGGFFGTLGDENPPKIPVAAIGKVDGTALRDSVENATGLSKGTLQLNPEGIPQPDVMAEFSSRGPNNDGWIKPEITAPGVDIYSATIPKAPNAGGGMPDPSGYISASGTSMATPHVAGAVALIRQAHPDWTPLQIKAILVNTARFMHGQGTVMDQGSGAINLEAAIDGKAILVTAAQNIQPTHSFGRVAHEGKVRKVSQELQLAALPGAIESQKWALSVELVTPNEGLVMGLSTDSLEVGPQGTGRFELDFTADGAEARDGICYGWVVAAAGGSTLRLPFYAEVARTLNDHLPPPQQSNQGQTPFPPQPVQPILQ